MGLNEAKLEIDFYDPTDDAGRTAVFEMRGNIQVTEGVTPNYLVEDFGEKAVATFQSLSADAEVTTERRSYTVDVAAGSHTFDIQFLGWEGSNTRWGTDGGKDDEYDGTTKPDPQDGSQAVDGDAIYQMNVLNQVLVRGTTDSLNPARLYFGEYDPSGEFSSRAPIDCQVDSISGNVTAQDGKQRFNGNIQLTKVRPVDALIDGVDKLKF